MLLRAACAALVLVIWMRAQNPPPPAPSHVENPAAAAPEAPPLPNCPAGAPLGALDLRVGSAQNPEPLPFRNINHLAEGDTLLYAPLLRGREKRPGEIALVLVPVKIDPDKPMLVVTDPRPAEKPQQWKIPEPVSLAAFVYGPEGLSKRKVRNLLMTTVGGLGHTMPYLVPDRWANAFWIATAIAGVVVFFELWAIAFIRARYMDTPFLQAVFQIVLGGVIVLGVGILIGGA